MSREQEIRSLALAIKARLEIFRDRHASLKGSSNPTDVLALLAEMQTAVAEARDEMVGLLGLTPAAIKLIDDEIVRLRRDVGDDFSDEDLQRSKIGEIIAGLRVRRSDEGGEA